MVTHYYTASSLDGFIATTEHSLDWLFKQDIDLEGSMAYPAFIDRMGALAMGASTYESIQSSDDEWGYTKPTWVFTHRKLPLPAGADVTLTDAPIAEVHAAMTAAAGGKDLWIVGGGDLAGQFAEAGFLDEVWVQFAPVTLGKGAPLLPRTLDLELLDVARNRNFMCGRYRVISGSLA